MIREDNTLPLCFTKVDKDDPAREFVLCVSLCSIDYNDINPVGM